MTIADFLTVLRRNWILLVVALLIGAGVAGVYAAKATPKYEAESTVLVNFQLGSTVNELQQGAAFTKLRIPTYVGLVTTPPVLDPVISGLGLSITAEKLATAVTAKSPSDTNLITISVQSADPQRAADIANALATSLASAVQTLETGSSRERSPVELTTVAAATPGAHGGTNVPLTILIGALLGLVLGLVVAIIRALLDTRVRSRQDIEQITHIPVLGTVSVSSAKGAEAAGPAGNVAAMRPLVRSVQFLQASHRATLVVTSDGAQDGASVATASLGQALAAAGSSVVIVDADLRAPKIAQRFGLDCAPGLVDVLRTSATLEDAARRSGEHQLYVLPAGEPTDEARDLLGGNRMTEILDVLGSRFDVVLVSAPALQSSADAAVLGHLADGILLVVATGATTRAALRSALGAVQFTGIEVLGIVEAIGSTGSSRVRSADRGKRRSTGRPGAQPKTVQTDECSTPDDRDRP